MSLSTPPGATPSVEGFDAPWLAQREPYDRAARDPLLLRRFARVLTAQAAARDAPRSVRLLDLAAGSGAQLRALAPHLAVDQHWTLVDHDPALLHAQHHALHAWAAQHGHRVHHGTPDLTLQLDQRHCTVHSTRLDLRHEPGGTLALGAFDGITTTAFLDLVSAAWLERFVDHLHAARRPLWATLSIDGERRWQPEDPDDTVLLAAFCRHQRGDKGFGPALGAAAPQVLAQALRARGWEVHTAPAPWRLGPRDSALLHRLARETAQVAIQAEPSLWPTAAAWQARRTAPPPHAPMNAARLHLQIGHVDLLALPPAA